MGAAEITADIKRETPLGCMLEETFVEGTFVVHDELGILLQEGREAVEGIGRDRRCWGCCRGWFNKGLKGNVDGAAIVEENGVCRL